MLIRKHLHELITEKKMDLGATPWIRLDHERMQAFSRFADLGFKGGAMADTSVEVEPFAAMSLIPSLLGCVFQIVDATAHRLVAVEQCTFVSSIPVGAEFAIEATLISGKWNTERLLVYRLGLAFQLRGQNLPSIIAEVVGLAGNP
jgi:hypothetical protein